MNRARRLLAPRVHAQRATGTIRSLSTLTLLVLAGLPLASSCGVSPRADLLPTGDGQDSSPQPGSGAGGPYAVGTELAVVELTRPSSSGSFLLRATVPIPPQLYPRTDHFAAFSIRTPEGTIVPAQNEVVTRYPGVGDGADVVEVIARVSVPQDSTSERLVYSVVWDPHPPERARLAHSVKQFLRSSAPLLVQSRDVFGNVYSSDLLRDLRVNGGILRTARKGRCIDQVVLHEWLEPNLPSSGPQGTLPHLMGLHAFVSLYDREEFFSLDLRVHNGGSGLDPQDPRDDPLGELFFEDLRLRLPSGWKLMSAVSDPYLGPEMPAGPSHVSVPIVKRLPQNKLHLMPAQAQFQRRLVIYKDEPRIEARARAALREEGLAFVRRVTGTPIGELFSWWNADTARYFPQNQRLPDLGFLGEAGVRAGLTSDLAQVEQALESGDTGPWPIVSEALGWCHPWGPSIGFLHGGSEIFLLDGLRTAFAASREGYLLHQRIERMYTCRQPDTLYNADGSETCVENWLVDGGTGVTYLPVWIFLTPVLFLGDSFGFGNAPTFQQDAVAALGLEPDYAADLREYQPIDIQHMVRYSRSLKVLAWLGNDALAKSDLRMQAELMRLSYNRWPQAPSGQAIATGMYKDSEYVHTNPGEGLDVTRGEGWALDTVAAAYAMADPAWRENAYPWFQSIVDLFHLGQETCSGVVGSVPNWSWFNAQYRLRQSISAAILENAMWGTSRTVFDGRDNTYRDRALGVLERSAYAMISPEFWNDAEHAPYFFVATGPFDVNLPGYCGLTPAGATQGSDGYQCWSSFAYAYLLTGDAQFLNRATEMAGGDLLGAVSSSGPGELENRAALLVLLQEQAGM